MDRVKKVTIEIIEDEVTEKEIVIKKAPLGQWAKLTKTINSLLNAIPEIMKSVGIEEKDQEEFLKQLTFDKAIGLIPEILDCITDEFISIVAIGADLEEEFVREKVGLDDALLIFKAIIEVNKFKKKAEEVGKSLVGQLMTAIS